MRVLITGGAGFIGSHLAEQYLAQGHQVTILDAMTTGSAANIAHIADRLEIHQGDIRDAVLVDSLIAQADLVLHMAAALGVKNIMENTVESVNINFTGSDIVLKSATKHNKRIIIASTSEIYGKNPQQPLNEESDRVVGAPQKIRWTYSDAKALEEAIAHTLHRTHGLKVTTVRFFNTVGPRQTGQYGMVLPRFVKAALKNEDITIYDDGSQSRVFCHVEDAVRAVMAIAADDKTIGDYFNIGGIGETTIKQLAEKVIELTNSKSKIVSIPFDKAYGPGFEDMQRRVPDISKIQAALGWAPIRNLDQVIESVKFSLSEADS